MSPNVIDVAIALVHRGGRWLVARRPQDTHLGGMWEFPGGKQEPDESPSAAALRELHEECHVSARVESVMTPVTWDYGDRVVRITPVVCRWSAGDGSAIANEACRWVAAEKLEALEMPAVNAEIIRELVWRSRHDRQDQTD